MGKLTPCKASQHALNMHVKTLKLYRVPGDFAGLEQANGNFISFYTTAGRLRFTVLDDNGPVAIFPSSNGCAACAN